MKHEATVYEVLDVNFICVCVCGWWLGVGGEWESLKTWKILHEQKQVFQTRHITGNKWNDHNPVST